MAEAIRIEAVQRDRAGKGAARAARRDGKIPGVVYGNRLPPVLVNLERISFNRLVRDPNFLTHTYDLVVGSDTHHVLARDVQYHPVTGAVEHVDFLRVGADTTINVMVPVEFLNQDKCPGIRIGGVLNVVRFEVELVCRAEAIPERLEVDLAKAQAGDSIHISAVKLPEGTRPVIADRDFTVATIAAPSGAKAEQAEVEDEDAIEAA